MVKKKVALGILGAAGIAPRSIIEPGKNLDNLIVYGIAARDETRAREFADRYNIPHTFKDYDALLACQEIDAVYIPLANYLHTPWILKAAREKKHILVEKPICLVEKDIDNIETAINENGVYLAEAIMVWHHPWQQKIREIIESAIYKKLQSIDTQITFLLAKSDRNQDSYVFYPGKGGGVFYDVGTYWVQFVQNCLRLKPDSVKGVSEFAGPNGIDATFDAEMIFPGGVTARFHASFDSPYEATHYLTFEKARLRVRNFFRPVFGKFEMSIDIHHLETDTRDKIVFPRENYYENQLRYFLKVLQGEEKNEPISKCRERVRIMEEIYRSARLLR